MLRAALCATFKIAAGDKEKTPKKSWPIACLLKATILVVSSGNWPKF